MPYKAIILDVDGTLVAHGEPSARPAVAEMVRRVQALGVKVVIATGRTYYAMNTSILGGIKPDYAVCANGAQVLADAGRLLASGAVSQAAGRAGRGWGGGTGCGSSGWPSPGSGSGAGSACAATAVWAGASDWTGVWTGVWACAVD